MNAVMSAVATPSKVVSPVMQAVVFRKYGEPDVLGVEVRARPVPAEGEVLVRVHAALVSIGDHHVVTGKPYAIRVTPYGGLPGPKHVVPGQCLSGVVEAVGAKVSTLRVGDEVFGQANHGAFAEYAVVRAAVLVEKPKNVSFEEAAALPWGATALDGFRVAGLKAGQRVLVNGASGAVGTWAVQVARAQGAHVTAVCSARNAELVRSLGAEVVLDYAVDDFVKGGAQFDVMFDLVGNRTNAECRSVLLPGGTWLPCFGGGNDWVGPMWRIIGAFLTFMFSGKKVGQFITTPKQEKLVQLKELVEAGKAKPVIERTYSLSEVGVALTHIGEGHVRGQQVVRIAG